MVLFLPETSSPNILLRRAQRLRKLTGDNRLKAQSEIDQANMTPKDVAYEALVRPAQLIFLDPSIGFTAGYVALCYGIYYSFFEAFPIVYIDMYGFNIGEMGLTFLSITVGVIIAIAAYYAYIWYVVEPDIRANGLGAPEKRLIPALVSSFFLPVGLFWFGWTGNGDIYWIVSVIGKYSLGYNTYLRQLLIIPIKFRHNDFYHWGLHPHPMCLRLSAAVLSSVRSFSLRRQRRSTINPGFRGGDVFTPHVSGTGNRTRLQPAGRPNSRLHWRHLHSILLWRELEG